MSGRSSLQLPTYSDLDDETLAHVILSLLHGIGKPDPSQLAVAVGEVRRDRTGAAWLASDMTITPPSNAAELRVARATGRYLGSVR